MMASNRPDNGPHWRRRLYIILFEGDRHRLGKLFDEILMVAILASVIVVMLDSVDRVLERYGAWLHAFEWTFTILFTIEYVARLASVQSKRRYAFSFFGIVDLLSIVPTYMSLLMPGAQVLAAIRLLRVLRVFRVLKLVRYLGEADLLGRALVASRYRIAVFLITVLTSVVILGSFMYLIEGAGGGIHVHTRVGLLGGRDVDHGGIRRHHPGDGLRSVHGRARHVAGVQPDCGADRHHQRRNGAYGGQWAGTSTSGARERAEHLRDLPVRPTRRRRQVLQEVRGAGDRQTACLGTATDRPFREGIGGIEDRGRECGSKRRRRRRRAARLAPEMRNDPRATAGGRDPLGLSIEEAKERAVAAPERALRPGSSATRRLRADGGRRSASRERGGRSCRDGRPDRGPVRRRCARATGVRAGLARRRAGAPVGSSRRSVWRGQAGGRVDAGRGHQGGRGHGLGGAGLPRSPGWRLARFRCLRCPSSARWRSSCPRERTSNAERPPCSEASSTMRSNRRRPRWTRKERVCGSGEFRSSDQWKSTTDTQANRSAKRSGGCVSKSAAAGWSAGTSAGKPASVLGRRPSPRRPNPQQCSWKAVAKSLAMSSTERPSIWNRSSMNTTSPSFNRPIDGDEGG